MSFFLPCLFIVFRKTKYLKVTPVGLEMRMGIVDVLFPVGNHGCFEPIERRVVDYNHIYRHTEEVRWVIP